MKFLLIIILLSGFASSLNAQVDGNNDSPNIVLILVDDMGLMDLGVYGGEAQTPNIDSLAQKGVMFTNLHASPVCAPSRAMLMTGSDSHIAGVANLPEMLPKKYLEAEGYEGVLNDNVQTIATRLKEHNYNTYIAGKWHLGHDENTLPNARGFDRSIIFGGSGADNYSEGGYLPFKPEVKWFADGKETSLPDDFYSSEFYIDQMISFHNDEQNLSNPFFAFLSFQAVHAPIQAPKEFVEKYRAIYSKGWDVLRQERFEKSKEMGIIPDNVQMNPTLNGIGKWEDLSAEEKDAYAIEMAMLAGMIEAMDFHIGRYIEYLNEKGLTENTIFIVTSDNGPDGGDYSGIIGWANRHGYHHDYKEKGGEGYYGHIGPGYASAIAAPFSHFKYFTGEGGLRVPLIISGGDLPLGKKDNELCFITDIAPTIYDIVGLSTSANEGYASIAGKSMLPHIKDNKHPIYKQDEGVGIEAAGCSAYFLGDYKIVYNNNPYGNHQWRMYNLKVDPCETKDISVENPLMFQTLLSKYEIFAKDVGVVSMPKSYSAQKEVGKKSKRAILNPFK